MPLTVLNFFIKLRKIPASCIKLSDSKFEKQGKKKKNGKVVSCFFFFLFELWTKRKNIFSYSNDLFPSPPSKTKLN